MAAITIRTALKCGLLTAAMICCLFSGHEAYAQGSPYYFLGFGNPVISSEPHLISVAGAGVALTDPSFINDINPAALAYVPRTELGVGLRFDYTQSTLGAQQGTGQYVKLGAIAAAAPIWSEERVGFAIGFSPLTDAEAQTQRSDSLGETLYLREGGLSQFYLAASVRPISALALGARFDLLFGNIRTQFEANLSGDQVQPGIFQREYSESGIRGTFGMLLSLDSIFHQLKGLTIGASYSTSSSLTSTQRTVVTPINSTLDSEIDVPGYGFYPSEIHIGLAGKISDRTRVEADISGQDFSNAVVYSPVQNAPSDGTLGPSNRYSFALERSALGPDEVRGAPFWDKVGLRIGGTYALLPFRPAPGVTVNEIGGTLGLGLPFGYASMIDFSAEFGIHSPSNTTIAPKDLYFRLGVSIMISEKWFVPLRRDDDD